MSAPVAEPTIDPRGTLKNMLHEGFSARAAISEKIDNSLDAGARNVIIHVETVTQVIAFADDGHGVDTANAKTTHRINNHKKRSKSRHGRFGRGGTQGTVLLTNLKHASHILSRYKNVSSSDPKSAYMTEGKLDWPGYIEANMYNPFFHGVTFEGLEMWEKYCVDPKKTGTVFIVPCDTPRFDDVLTQLNSKDIQTSLVYWLGRVYYKYIADGVNIIVNIDGTETRIPSNNPLVPTYTVPAYRNKSECVVYQQEGTGAIRVYCPENKEMCRYDFTNSATGKRIREGKPKEDDWKEMSRFTIESVYIPKDELIDALEDTIDSYNSPVDENGDWNQDARGYLYGIFYERNGKIVTRMDIPSRKSGDKKAYQYYEQTVHLISFDADLDDLFDIQVNKSRVDEANFHQEIAKTTRRLMNSFSSAIYSKNRPTDKDSVTTESTEETATASSPVTASPVVAPVTVEDKDDIVESPLSIPSLMTVAPAHTPARIAAPAPAPTVPKNEVIALAPESPVAIETKSRSSSPVHAPLSLLDLHTTTQRNGSQVEAPKTEQFAFQMLFELFDKMETENRADFLKKLTGKNAGQPYTGWCKVLKEISTRIEEYQSQEE